jgi:hypothetical protein
MSRHIYLFFFHTDKKQQFRYTKTIITFCIFEGKNEHVHLNKMLIRNFFGSNFVHKSETRLFFQALSCSQ